MSIRRILFAGLVGAVFLIAGCGSDDKKSPKSGDAVDDVEQMDETTEETASSDDAMDDTDPDALADAHDPDTTADARDPDGSTGDTRQMVSVEMSFQNLTGLGEDFTYELWFIVDGNPVSISRFSPESLDEKSVTVEKSVADNASAAVVTIEPKEGDDPAPSKTHILAGELKSLSTGAEGSASTMVSAQLTINSDRAIGTEFAEVSGEYILKTPTTETTDDYSQGIWFLDPTGGSPAASLDLPQLPEGWTYEGWVVNTAVNTPAPTTTGRFRNLDEADSDGAGEASGPKGAPPFPGQDFIDPSIELANGDYRVVISVEPEPDNSDKPFALKPLLDKKIEDVGAGTPQSLSKNGQMALPTGSIDIDFQR